MGEPRQVAVGAGRVDDDEVVGVLDRCHRLGEGGKFDALVVVELETSGRAPRRSGAEP